MSGSRSGVKRLWNNAFSLSIKAGLKHNRSCMNEISLSHERIHTKTCFEKEAKCYLKCPVQRHMVKYERATPKEKVP